MPTLNDKLFSYFMVPIDWTVDNVQEALSFFTGRRGRRSFQQKDVGKTKNTQCAAWSNGDMRKRGYSRVSGNAWNPSGRKLVATGYKRMKSSPAITSGIQDINQYNWNAADSLSKYFDYNKLDKNKIYTVNMYSTGSPYSRVALAEGDRNAKGTHTGQLRYDKKSGWTLLHNWHGTIKSTPIQNVYGSDNEIGITSIWEPQK